MDKEINSQFDIALLGYGAYDMQLGVAIKRDGRQGDPSQWITSTVFWIRSHPWDDMSNLQHLFNDAWVRASAAETPQCAIPVDTVSYW